MEPEKADEIQPEDWVMVADVSRPAELEALTGALDEAGIPFREDEQIHPVAAHAAIVPESVRITNTFTIRVPLTFFERAERIIDETVLTAIQRGVEQAFAAPRPEALIEGGQITEELQDLCRLAERPWAERSEKALAYLADWLTDGTSEVQIAENLAAAGFSEQEAHRLVARVVQQRRDLFRATREYRAFWMKLLLGAAGACWIMVLMLVLFGSRKPDGLTQPMAALAYCSFPLAIIGLIMRYLTLSADHPKEPRVLGKEFAGGDA